MGKYLHRFETDAEFGPAYNGDFYHEPWVSLTVENGDVNYNKTIQETPVTFEIVSGGNFYWICGKVFDSIPDDAGYGIWYKINDGAWTEIEEKTILDMFAGQEYTALTPNFTVVAGDIVQFKGYNPVCGGSDYAGVPHGFFTDENVRFNAKGNIMSLISGDNFSRLDTLDTDYEYQFANVFGGCSGLVSASELLLPATTLAIHCYFGMFAACENLKFAPELPATTLADSCYYYMFGYCHSLEKAPALPATTLASACYNFMFYDCTSLTDAPELPATTLAEYCYYYMFARCTNLTTAPELPATTLTNSCYENMFRGCTNLGYIKCLATNISAYYCTNNWVDGVSEAGTFVKAPTMSSWTTGDNGIPNGWIVQTA